MAYPDYNMNFKALYQRILDTPGLSNSNKKAIDEHITYLKAKSSSDRTITKHLYCIQRFLKSYNLDKDFIKAKKEDIEEAIAKLDTLKLDNGKQIAPETKRNVKVVVKAFWKHLKGDDEFYPSEVRWIKSSGNNTKRILPQNLLDEKDIIKMISATSSFRNKAIISLLYDSGIRIGELINIYKKDINLEGKIGYINVNGKTGMRRIPITFSVRYIAQYLNLHKDKKLEEPLFTTEGTWSNLNYKSDYQAIRKMLKETSAKAKITKPVNPHAFRHSRATDYAGKGINDRVLMEYFGWRSPDIISTYTHLSGKNITDAVLQANGIKPIERQIKSKLEDRKCSRCDFTNTLDSVYCNRCGAPLEIPEAMNSLILEEAVKRIINRPQTISDIREAVKKEEAKINKTNKKKTNQLIKDNTLKSNAGSGKQ